MPAGVVMPGYASIAARPSVGEKNSDGEPSLGAASRRPVEDVCPSSVVGVLTRCVACACASVMPSLTAPKPSGPRTVLDNCGGEVVIGGTVPVGTEGVVMGPVDGEIGVGVVTRFEPDCAGRAVDVPVLFDVQPATATTNAAMTATATTRTDDIAPPDRRLPTRAARPQDRSGAARGR